MDQARHVDARHAPDKSQQPVRRPPANPQRKIYLWVSRENTHEAGNTDARPSAEVAHLTSRLLI